MGKAILTIMAAFAQLERDTMVERTRAGLAAAAANGRMGGRPQDWRQRHREGPSARDKGIANRHREDVRHPAQRFTATADEEVRPRCNAAKCFRLAY